MLNLDKHPYFKAYVDEKSGVKSYLLTEKVAQLQQHFYFTDSSLTEDGKFLWFRCLNAPAQSVHLAVLSMDAENPFIRSFPGAATTGSGGLPSIIPGTHDVIFGSGAAVYKINPEGEITQFFTLDPEFVHNRPVEKVFTHASLSCDGKYMVLDMMVGGKWYVGLGDLKTGEIKILNNFGRCYNHAMFSPVNPELFLIDQDWWRDYHTGEYFPIDNRMWLMNTSGTRFEPLLNSSWYGHDGSYISHDFWSKDGKICWVDYAKGAFECDVDTKEVTHVWKRPMCHCHTTPDRRFWCADQNPYEWDNTPCQMLFYDRETAQEIEVFSALPAPKVKRGGAYHLDPHPSFTADGAYIISTTTVLNRDVDVAITPVAPLIDLCHEKGTVIK